MSSDNLAEKVNKIYDKKGYIQQYGGDVVMALCIAITLIGINIYLYVINHLKGLKKKWNDETNPINCNPLYMPFASVINPPADGNDLQYVEDNADLCAKKSLGGLGNFLVSPFTTIINDIISVLLGIADSLKAIITSLGSFTDSISGLLGDITDNLSNTIDTHSKIFNQMSQAINRFTIINTVVAHLVSGFAYFGQSLLNNVNPAACFDKETKLVLADGSIKSIENLTIGEQLLHDGVVTSVLKFSSTPIDMYTYKGIIVSGNHYVYENKLCIPVKSSINSSKISHYPQKDIWCITTASKQIHINDVVFCDYDDVTIEDCDYLKRWIYNRYQVSYPSTYDIHACMNGGLIDTPIRMQDSSYKPLSSVEIDDVVFPNSKVCGTVVIFPKDMKIRTVEVKGQRITGGTNVQILDKHLGCSYNIMDSIEKHSSTDNPLYHLITDKGGFYVNDVFIGDYSVNMGLFFKEDRQSILSII
tara:strand:+ start:12992 stop:14413 length:1422 start_codon:yes stop_codon:yes gene_type:complete